MSFAIWTDRLLEAFFGEFAADQQVRLSVSKDLLDSEFADLGGSNEFARVVRRGPDWPAEYDPRYREWNQPGNFVDRALGLYRQWKWQNPRHSRYNAPHNDAPPYFPYLCILCYAWTIEGDGLAGHNFYDRLEQVYPHHALNMQLGSLNELWTGLQEWSEKHNGNLGCFAVEQLGGMQHVGIPKAQVILTASRIDALPSLFGGLGIASGGQVGEAQLRDLLIHEEATTRHFLGKDVGDAIADDEPIGRAAISQLIQHYEQWDGVVPESAKPHDQGHDYDGSPSMAAQGRLLLGLQPRGENEGWSPLVHAAIDDLPSGVVRLAHAGQSWVATLLDGIAGPFVNTANTALLGGAFVLAASEDSVAGTWYDEVEGERSIALRCQARSIRVLHWVGSSLVEQPGLPAEGNAYVLVGESSLHSWSTWVRAISQRHGFSVYEGLPQSGLPQGWRLTYVAGLGSLSDSDWGAFPTGDDGRRMRPRLVRLVGGSRARRTGIRKTYLPYDLPKIVVEAEGSLAWQLSGARLEPLAGNTGSLPPWLSRFDRGGAQSYRVLIDMGAAVVVAKCRRNGVEIGRVSFGVVRDGGDAGAGDGGNLRLDKLGEPTSTTSGIVGSEAPTASTSWGFFDGPFVSWDMVRADLSIDGACFIFSDWLAQNGHVPYSRARDFAAEILASKGAWVAPTREMRALSLLGSLEIGLDSKGRWATVHAVPCTLSPLPMLRHGQYQIILLGTPTRAFLGRLVQAAHEREIAVESCPQLSGTGFGYQLARPRLCFLGKDLAAFADLARAAEAIWEPSPAAWRMAEWAGALAEWIETMNWFPEAGPVPEATYRPCEFLTKDGDEFPAWGNLKLGRSDDPITRRHFSYMLARRDAGRFQHAYVAQRPWATWHVHGNVMQGLCQAIGHPPLASIRVAYSPEKDVVIPLELELPVLLARAFVSCSGLVPNVIRPDEYFAYADASHGFTPGFGYKGLCLGYRNVPGQIADRVLRKVGAAPVVFPPLPELRL